ncbi:hypothetical protein MNBD_GAMMA08-3037 [hydrothermal vent metagenome]|uniref:Ice-binding protein C-terminal domain-containing protein n=1 Tax=hydrothermal vent metagenome TaxID=652676 RepID=A0A3B0XSF9_9ZZZZ
MKHLIISTFAVACLSISSLSQAITVDINFNSLPQANISPGDTYTINAFTTLTTEDFVGVGPGLFDETITAIGSGGGTAIFTFDTSAVNVTSISLGGASNNAPVTITTFDFIGDQLDTFDTDNNWTEIATLTNASPLSFFSVRLLESEISSLSFTYTNVDPGNGGTSPVPVPAAIWLFGTGLIGLAGMLRRKRA